MKNKVLIGLSTGEFIRRADFLPSFMGIIRPDNSLSMSIHGQSPAKSRNMIIDEAAKNGCTHILFLDDDMIVPPDTLMKLLAHDKDIVSALYLLRTFPHYPAAFDEAYDNGKCKYLFLNNQKPELTPVANLGLGCVLIKTEMFSHLTPPYVRLGEIEKDGWCDDIGFFNRCREAGYEIYCDLNAPVGHMLGVTLWPEHFEGTWYSNYKHDNGNVRIAQHYPEYKEIKKEATMQDTRLLTKT